MTEQANGTETAWRVSLQEAADLLNTTVDAVRMRARRGTLRSEKGDDGRVYVWVDPDQGGDKSHDKSSVEVQAYEELVEDLRGQVGYLRAELREERQRHAEADRENRRIVAGLISRVPELEALRDPMTATDVHDGVEVHDAGADAHKPPQTAQEGQRSPWWRRIFE